MHCVRSWRIYHKDDCSSLLSALDRNKSPPTHSLHRYDTILPSENYGTKGSVCFHNLESFENIIF